MTKKELEMQMEAQSIQRRMRVRQEVLRIDPDLDPITLFAREDYICGLADPMSMLLQMEMSSTYFENLYQGIPWSELEGTPK